MSLIQEVKKQRVVFVSSNRQGGIELKKIHIPANVYAALEEKAKAKGLTPDELAARIILIRARV